MKINLYGPTKRAGYMGEKSAIINISGSYKLARQKIEQ